MRRFWPIAALAVVAACAPPPPVTPLALPCSASASAEVEREPVAPALTPEQRLAVDVAIVRAAGPVLGSAIIRHSDVEHPAWGRRQAERIEQTRRECQGRVDG